MLILDNTQIKQKIQRLAVEIVENNYEHPIALVGVNNNGYRFGKLLLEAIHAYHPLDASLHQVRLNPREPHVHPIELETGDLSGKNIIIVDDVANTGRTLFYAASPLLRVMPPKLEVAVLIDRRHKNYPVHVRYVGLSLSTTLRQHIDVRLEDAGQYEVWLRM